MLVYDIFKPDCTHIYKFSKEKEWQPSFEQITVNHDSKTNKAMGMIFSEVNNL